MRDTDATGLVFHPRYLEILTNARENILETIGLNHKFIVNHFQAMLVVRDVNVSFIKPAFLHSKLIIRSKVEKLLNAKISISQNIYLDDDPKSPILIAKINYAYIDVINLSPRLIPQEIATRFIS
jgi:acyl-CoA thioester hydrolase